MGLKWPDLTLPPINLWRLYPTWKLNMSDPMTEWRYEEQLKKETTNASILRQKDKDPYLEDSSFTTWDYVKKDIELRERAGYKKYGKFLNPKTTEDMLQHAYEEALDLTVYLKTLLLQRNEKSVSNP